MEQPPAAPANPVSVIGPQYCRPQQLDLLMDGKFLTLTEGKNEIVMFKIEEKPSRAHNRRLLLDATGNPICTLRRKIITAHGRWKVFRGYSTKERDLIFSVKRSSMIQVNTELRVFLGNNTREDVCDFRVKGSFSQRACVIYSGVSNTIVAQMNKVSMWYGNDKFMVKVQPNVDYAFIVALVAILVGISEINGQRNLLDGIRETSSLCNLLGS